MSKEIASNRPLQDNKLIEVPVVEINHDENLELNDELLEKLNPNKTVRDLEELSIYEKLSYDSRNFITYFWDSLKEEHVILNILFYYSLYIPRYVRVIKSISVINLMFTMNALFYSDEAMEKTQQIASTSVIYIYRYII